jgi:hypothetical protein
MISGVENAWRSPVLNSDGDVQWVSMHTSNRDMEFSMWMDFLIKLISGVFQIDPMELGFKYGNSGQDKAMFETGNMAKLTASRDKGLRPLLEFVAEAITDYIIKPIDKDFVFEFIGLERHSKDDLAKLNQQRVKTTHTPNELRAEQDLEPLGDPDDPNNIYNNILDPVVGQSLATDKQMALAASMPVDGGGDGSEDPDQPDDGADTGPDFSEEDFVAAAGDIKKALTLPRKTVRMTVEV